MYYNMDESQKHCAERGQTEKQIFCSQEVPAKPKEQGQKLIDDCKGLRGKEEYYGHEESFIQHDDNDSYDFMIVKIQ